MNKDRKTVLQLLKKELEFVNGGGYSRSPSFPWRPRYIFEESPSCPNSSDRTRPHRCADCWLMEFVASDLRSEQTPCRFVQLAPKGVTVDALYRCGTWAESEEALSGWLNRQIHELEQEIELAEEMGINPTSAAKLAA
jgi:hypothetical protein